MVTGIWWKQRKLRIRQRGQINLVTLYQTVGLLVFIYLDNSVLSYLLGTQQKSVFILETLRIILIENIFLKFLLPILLIINSKTRLPALWVDKHHRRLEFFTSSPSFIPRRPPPPPPLPLPPPPPPPPVVRVQVTPDVREARKVKVSVQVHAGEEPAGTLPPVEV